MYKAILLVVLIGALLTPVKRSDYITYSIKDNFCPTGYWLADVRKNEHTGTQTFDILNLPSKADVCRYCEEVSCFIFKHPKWTNQKSGDKIDIVEDKSNMQLIMTCKNKENLPEASLIVEYLDCVKMGYEKLFHLFLYLPKFSKFKQSIDFFDPEFLDWMVKDKKKLLSLELGFPMKRLPQYFVNHYTPILENATRVCFDASHMRQQSAKFEDISTPNKSEINRIYVFRTEGLSRIRASPEIFDIPDCSENYIKNKDCLIQFQNIRSALKGVIKSSLSDRLKINSSIFISPFAKMTSNDLYYYKLASMLLLLLVIVFTFGSIVIFCFNNRDKGFLRWRKKKKFDSDFLVDPIEEMSRMNGNDMNANQWNMYQANGMMNNQMMNRGMMMAGNYDRNY